MIVIARDGTPLRAFASENGVWRYPVTLDEVSPLYLEALLGYEDRWFWRHPGVNPIAMLRAAGQWAAAGHVVSGGSTLTMQVARILEPGQRNALGKARQILRALQLEWHLSKREILTLYLNHAPFGGTIEGVEAASWAYLGKPARNLSHAEAALLAVLPQAPSRLRPDRHNAAAQVARDKVLRADGGAGSWTRGEVVDARIEPVVSRRMRPPMLAPLLAERLRREHPGRTRIRPASTPTCSVRWKIASPPISRDCRSAPRRRCWWSTTRPGARRPTSARSPSPSKRSLGHVDMVRATRSPGSTLKPFLYGLALDDGLIHSESLLVDAPQTFGDYRPANFDPVLQWTGVRRRRAAAFAQRAGGRPARPRRPGRFAARLAHAGIAGGVAARAPGPTCR